MDLSDYIEEVSPTEIKVRGHRVWIEHVLNPYLGLQMNVEEIERELPTLSRAQILAVLLYYHANTSKVDHYLAEHRRSMDNLRAEYWAKPENQRLNERLKAAIAERRAKAGV